VTARFGGRHVLATRAAGIPCKPLATRRRRAELGRSSVMMSLRCGPAGGGRCGQKKSCSPGRSPLGRRRARDRLDHHAAGPRLRAGQQAFQGAVAGPWEGSRGAVAVGGRDGTTRKRQVPPAPVVRKLGGAFGLAEARTLSHQRPGACSEGDPSVRVEPGPTRGQQPQRRAGRMNAVGPPAGRATRRAGRPE